MCDVALIGCEDEENLGLRYIGSFLESHGIQAEIIPFERTSKEEILAFILKRKPKIVGFSIIFQRYFYAFRDLIEFLRQEGVKAHFTVGGHFPTVEYEKTLELIPSLDSVIRHEGELTLYELYQKLHKPASKENIKGIAYRENGVFKSTSSRPLIKKLDSLPFPRRSKKCLTHRGIGMCAMIASRGCYYNCSFCSVRQFYSEPQGDNRRSRSPGNVVAEMEQLFKEKNIRIFIFKDDDLCTQGREARKWISDFIKELKLSKLAEFIQWRISCRVNEIDKELIEQLKEVGLMALYIGIESGSRQGLKTFNKGYSVENIYQALNILKETDMPFEFGFMFFDPDSTFHSLKENVKFLETIGQSGDVVINFTKMFPYAGTSIAHRLEKEARLQGSIDSPDYSYTDPRIDLVQYFFSIFHDRNFNPAGLVNRLQLAKFDAMIVKKYFAGQYDAEAYEERVKELNRRCNQSALFVMSRVLNFMEKRTEDRIIDLWSYLEPLAQYECEYEYQLATELDRLMNHYGFSELPS